MSENSAERILGIPNRRFWAIAYSAFCVFVECGLNMGGLLVWEYPWRNRSFSGIWLIFFFGYFHFYAATIFVLWLKSHTARIFVVASLYIAAIIANTVCLGFLGWVY